MPEPDAGRALVSEADAADGLAVFADGVIVLADQAEGEHGVFSSAPKNAPKSCSS
jgi:hypothetical protein